MKFTELDDEAKEKAREWMLEATAQDDWYADDVIRDWQTMLGYLGFRVPNIYYSGFWSQGDGACFTGSWRLDRVDYAGFASARSEQMAEKYGSWFREKHALMKFGGFPDECCVTLSHSGLYYHESSITFSYDCDEEQFGEEFEKEFEEECRDLMRAIYKQLEDEYEYRMSDDAIDEAIKANEYDFNELGEVQ